MGTQTYCIWYYGPIPIHFTPTSLFLNFSYRPSPLYPHPHPSFYPCITVLDRNRLHLHPTCFPFCLHRSHVAASLVSMFPAVKMSSGSPAPSQFVFSHSLSLKTAISSQMRSTSSYYITHSDIDCTLRQTTEIQNCCAFYF